MFHLLHHEQKINIASGTKRELNDLYVTQKRFEEGDSNLLHNKNARDKSPSNTKEQFENVKEEKVESQLGLNKVVYTKPSFAMKGRSQNSLTPEGKDRLQSNIRLEIKSEQSNTKKEETDDNRIREKIQDAQNQPAELQMPGYKPTPLKSKSEIEQTALFSSFDTRKIKESLGMSEKSNPDSTKPLADHQQSIDTSTNQQMIEKPAAIKNINPFESQPQQPVLLNLTPNKNTLKFRQNDLGKSTDPAKPTIISNETISIDRKELPQNSNYGKEIYSFKS